MRIHFSFPLPGRVVAVLLLVGVVAAPLMVGAKTVEELRAELDSKRSSLKNTETRIQEFKEKVQAKKQEARTLSDQITLIDDSIGELELDLTRTVQEIEKNDLEIERVEKEIAIKEQEIAQQKALLAEYIRSIHALDQQSTVAVFLKYGTFSEALNETSVLAELQSRGQATLMTIKGLHEDLTTKERELEDYKQSLEGLYEKQQGQQEILSNQRNSKERILELTNEQEEQYQSLLKEAQTAHQEAQAAIKALDARIREELRNQGIGALPSIGVLDWPIQPIYGVSCEFQCAGYPYAYLIGPHSAIDIPSHVGTPIKAPADGYVARTHDSGGPGYNYIMIIHGDSISTVYGHVSGFAVNEGQLITRGTVIGYTGGAPGTRGAGLSTGPHLHFEVRENNIPVNPRKYLGS